MALWHCAACRAAYAVGLAACPQCGGTGRDDEEDGMPKIDSAGLATGHLPAGAGTDAEPEAAEAPAAEDGVQQDVAAGEAEPAKAPRPKAPLRAPAKASGG